MPEKKERPAYDPRTYYWVGVMRQTGVCWVRLDSSRLTSSIAKAGQHVVSEIGDAAHFAVCKRTRRTDYVVIRPVPESHKKVRT